MTSETQRAVVVLSVGCISFLVGHSEQVWLWFLWAAMLSVLCVSIDQPTSTTEEKP